MTTIREEIVVNAPADAVWQAVRDAGEAHRRLFPGILADARLEDGARVVTFADGTVLRELIVATDDARRRLVYASVGGSASHHNASIEVVPDDDGKSRLIWITDVLPDELRDRIAGLMQKGAAVAKATLERDLAPRGGPEHFARA
jgi:carbon monoxide dehydrogenase subunit G